MTRSLRVLIVEDSEDDERLLLRELRRGGFEPEHLRVDTPEAMLAAFDDEPWDIVLSDYSMPRFSGMAALELLRSRSNDVPFILVSGTIGEEPAVAAMRAGAQDYIMKGKLARLAPAIERELKDAAVRRERAEVEAALRQAQKMEAVGRLAAGIAHDLNNLLTIIQSCGDLFELHFGDEELLRRDVDVLHRASQRGTALTGQLLAISRKQVVNPTVLEPGEAVTDLAIMVDRIIGEDVDFSIDVAPDAGFVLIDRGSLDQVLLNLVINARDAMPSGGRLSIEVRGQDRFVRIRVRDDGMGMNDATLAHLFEPFFTTKAEGIGTGLGLSTVRGIVKAAGGEIGVESAPGKGATFTIDLPRVERPASVPPPEPAAAPQAARPETILLVEDDAVIRRMAQEYLTAKGYRILAAGRGEEATRLAGREPVPIDILVSDITLPGENGVALAERLSRGTPGLRVLFMSGYPHEASTVPGALGEDIEFLQKPFGLDVLARKIRATLDRRPGR